jgi:hypothetical protein
MNPPIVTELTSPSNHNTTSMAAIVYSIFISPFLAFAFHAINKSAG